MGMGVSVAAAASRVDAETAVAPHRQDTAVRRHHIRPNLVHIGGMGVIHHIHRPAPRRPHIDLHPDELALLADALLVVVQAEKLHVHEAAPNLKGPYGGAPRLSQIIGHLRRDVIGKILLLVDNFQNGRRPHRHRLKQRLALGIDNRVVRINIPAQKLLRDIRHGILFPEEPLQFRRRLDAVRILRAHADIRLHDNRIADLPRERLRLPHRGNHRVPRRGDMRAQIIRLHRRLVAEPLHLRRLQPRRHIKIRAQERVLLQKQLIVRLDPIDFPVLIGKVRHRPKLLVVIRKRLNKVIIGQRISHILIEGLQRTVPNTQHRDPFLLQPIAKQPIIRRIIGRNKNKIHELPPSMIKAIKIQTGHVPANSPPL